MEHCSRTVSCPSKADQGGRRPRGGVPGTDLNSGSAVRDGQRNAVQGRVDVFDAEPCLPHLLCVSELLKRTHAHLEVLQLSF